MTNIFKTNDISFQAAGSIQEINSIIHKNIHLNEVAFVGRSNVGKSSLINKLALHNNLAFVSKEPGKTQSINFFNFNNKFILVDLPGYGYANVSHSKMNLWSELITYYILTSIRIKMLFLLLDARRGIMPKDLIALEWIDGNSIDTTVVITKADYIIEQDRAKLLENVYETTKDFSAILPEIFLISSKKNIGIDSLRRKITNLIQSA